ncbi:uncharacterized protein MELLADRAFT_95187 [Melampsora larici-populina 98AG31]|uniref:Uncharacterized protein n=1 Tax=Melampsora larici-populina (strain 98AG31 / pathotype 3-4-7) TaxID=747676 RepID=F4RCG2_MELLP|nr:uncharacterized protein MELLADRAFT_95187 [Melampsora larici-populina 98AG31]EGG09968.1 hypothetical protein MELLADRAFT_95187 [Melampsora larici-populina 98AG31]
MSSQNTRFHPYDQSTPSLNNLLHQTEGSSSLRGLNNHHNARGEQGGDSSPDVFTDTMGGGSSVLFRREAARTETNPILEKILQEIGNLLTKVSQVEIMSTRIDQVVQATSLLSNKIDDLSNKMDEVIDTVASLSSGQQVLSLSNKVDHLAATVAQLTAATQSAGTSAAPGSNLVATAPAAPAPWTVSTALKRVYQVAYALVTEAGLEAYTAIQADGNVLQRSLFNSIKQKVLAIGGQWVVQHLPPTINGFQDVPAGKNYNKLVKDAGNHAREKMHLLVRSLVLTNIRNPRDPSPITAPVPNIKKLVHRIANQFNTNPDKLDVDPLWEKTPWAQRLRVAYLRREAMRVVRGGGNIWARVDLHLRRLHERGPLYTTAFYKLVYDQDCAMFKSNICFINIPANVTFALPSDEEIEVEMNTMEPQPAVVQ